MPIRARTSAPASVAGAGAVFTFPVDGASSVARMIKSVDFPAPLGPSRPTISPAPQLN